MMADVEMPGPLTGAAVFSSWSWNVWVSGFLVLVAGGYLVAARRVSTGRAGGVDLDSADGTGERWPVGRTIAFLTGLLLFGYTTMSFLGVYQQVLFTVRAVQIITLLMVVPFFLALGAPLRLVLDAGPRFLASAVTAVLGSRAARLLTFPAVVSLVFLATPFTVYFSPIYEATLRSRGSAWVLSFALVLVGFFYYWTRLRLDPVPKEYPHLISVWITFAEAVADGALGLTLMLGHHLIAGDWYSALNRPWGSTPKQDQVWGGGALWLIGDLAGVPFIGALWRRMFHEDKVKAAEIDEELDALEASEALEAASVAASVAASGSGSGSGSDGQAPAPAPLEAGRMRPWWETDPVLGARYGAVEPE